VALAFTHITREYTPIDANGKSGTTIKTTWDVGRNAGTSTSFSAFKAESAVPPRVALEIKGVNGTVGEIPIDTFGWGASMSSAMTSGGGAGAGKADFNDLHLRMQTNAASPAFFGHAATGRDIQQVGLTVRDDAGRVLQRWTLEDVLLRSFQTGDANSDQSVLLTESFALSYSKIELEQYGYDANGKASPPVVFAWDVKLNRRV
jgi:type VI secretion system secreted protein Hcp